MQTTFFHGSGTLRSRTFLPEKHVSMKKAVKQGAVMKEKIPEVFINGEDAVPMGNIDKFKGHRGSTLHGIEITAGGTETAVAAEWNKFQLSTGRAAVHSPAKSEIAAVDHFIHVFNNSITWM